MARPSLSRYSPVEPAPAVQAATGLEAPSWADYWTFVTATIVVMFVLFLAKNGHLSTWIGYLGWSSPQALGASPASEGATTAAAGAAAVQDLQGIVSQ